MKRSLSRRVRLAVLSIVAVGLVAVAPARADAAPGAPASPAAPAQASGCPSAGSDFAATGPFQVTVQSEAEHTYYSPTNLGSQGCTRHPVIIWGNGTLTSPSWYDGLLRHWASHGFIVAAANTSNAGSGEEMLAGIDNLAGFDGQSGNRFYQRVDLDNVGATGHSQGGAGAVRAAMDSRVTTVFSVEGATTPTGVQGPAIFFAGESDPLRTSVRAAYDAGDSSGLPAAYAELAGAGHLVPLGDGGGFRGAMTAWARWQLMGDTAAAAQFVGSGCGLCTSNSWSDYEANSELEQLGGDPGDPGDPGDGECVTAANSAHVDAGRATSVLFFAFAEGSGDYLGLTSATTSLRQTGDAWELVDSC